MFSYFQGPELWKSIVRHFVTTFIGVFLVGLLPILQNVGAAQVNWSDLRSAVVALVAAALAAAIRVVIGLIAPSKPVPVPVAATPAPAPAPAVPVAPAPNEPAPKL